MDLVSDSDRPATSDELDGERPPGLHARATRRAATISDRLSGAAVGHVWQRLNAMDFMNRAMLFGAVLFLCFVPFLLIVEDLAGRSAATRLIKHFGLTGAAADATSAVFTSPATTSGITGLSSVLFVFGGLAAAGAIQELYERAFDLETRGIKDTPRRLVWLAILLGSAALTAWAGPTVHTAGGPALLAVLALVAVTGFWWFTMWLLLAGRIRWRALFPSALATALCWLGLSVVFNLTMSGTITSNYKKYGDIGVVLAFMSYLIAVGVVIILGAIIGLVWRLRRTIAPDSGAPARQTEPPVDPEVVNDRQ
jgi:membrane protein